MECAPQSVHVSARNALSVSVNPVLMVHTLVLVQRLAPCANRIRLRTSRQTTSKTVCVQQLSTSTGKPSYAQDVRCMQQATLEVTQSLTASASLAIQAILANVKCAHRALSSRKQEV